MIRLTPRASSTSVEFNTHGLQLVDINEDGKLDLVLMLHGDGKGAFKTLSEMPMPTAARSVTLGDVNGDGRADLVFSHSSNQLSVLLNQGGGKFTFGPVCDLGDDPFAVAVADVNRDQRNDLVAATVDSVTVLLNGKSGFAPAPGSPSRAGPGAYHLTTGDINRSVAENMNLRGPLIRELDSLFKNGFCQAQETDAPWRQPGVACCRPNLVMAVP